MFTKIPQWVNSLSFANKGLLFVVVPLLVHLSIIGVFLRLINRAAEDYQWAEHSKEIRLSLEEVRSSASAGFNRVLLGIILEKSDFEMQGQEYYTRSERKAAELVGRMGDNPPNQLQLINIVQKLKLLRSTLTEAYSFVQSSQPMPNVPTTSEQPVRTRGDVLEEYLTKAVTIRDSIAVGIDELSQVEKKIDNKRTKEFIQSLNDTFTLLMITFLILVALATLGYRAFRASISLRSKVITENLERISLNRPLGKELFGGDELGRIDRAIHIMATALQEKTLETELFLYSVSHDLRSPLVNLYGFTEELKLSVEELLGTIEVVPASDPVAEKRENLRADFERSFGFIQSAVDRLSRIIDSLLKLSRAGKIEYNRVMIDPNPILQRVISTLQNSASLKDAEIVLDTLPEVCGDSNALEQIFANLISNALQYLNPEKKGRIHIGFIPPETTAKSITIFVKDNGLGIAPTVQKKLFLAFQRFHPQAGSGEGIGLALIRRVISRLGGQIWCESEVGEGTTFFVTFPRNCDDQLALAGVLSFELPKDTVGHL